MSAGPEDKSEGSPEKLSTGEFYPWKRHAWRGKEVKILLLLCCKQ